ncbi:MAG: hypothetical protein NC299_09010 [Lachnospiraceae bacterium]|nr:hypothetical protein [Lachnospiraceae bacterium]
MSNLERNSEQWKRFEDAMIGLGESVGCTTLEACNAVNDFMSGFWAVHGEETIELFLRHGIDIAKPTPIRKKRLK